MAMASYTSSPLMKRFAGLAVLGVVVLWVVSPGLFPGNSKLYDAIETGDTARVQQLLEAGADPNSRSSGMTGGQHNSIRYQSPPLLYAIWRNQPAIALLLLEAGADPNLRHARDGDTPLIAAANAGMLDVVRLMIAKGVDVTAADRDGSTPLHHGPELMVEGAVAPKEELAPEMRAVLEQAGAR